LWYNGKAASQAQSEISEAVAEVMQVIRSVQQYGVFLDTSRKGIFQGYAAIEVMPPR
jgi:hypothetical protein